MRSPGLQKGDEVYVSVRINGKDNADIVINAVSSNEVAAELWCDAEADMVALHEAVKAACGAIDYQLQKPRLREMLAERIAQLKREAEEAEWDNPPAPTSDDILF